MKGQGGNSRKAAAEKTIKKVTKKTKKSAAVKAKLEAVEVLEEVKEAEEGAPVAVEMAEWCNLWSGVDEEMPWATSWIPFWEVESGGDAYDALYGDLMLDYDIWGFNGTGIA